MRRAYPLGMAFVRLLAALLLPSCAAAQTSQPFTLQQVLSAPFASQLTAAPASASKTSLFAWVEDAEGRRNLWVGGLGADGKPLPARQLTHNTEDDAQEIAQLAWSPDATALAYTYGASTGADGEPANPAHLQHATPRRVLVQPLAANAQPIVIGEGSHPLFTREGALLYIDDGQIWIADLPHRKQCFLPEGCPNAPAAATPTHQLVFDHGSAGQLALSPDGATLAFISRRREPNKPTHSLLALFDMQKHTLSFPAPSTDNDSAPAWSLGGDTIAWLRTPFTEPLEYANPRTSPTPWSIQLLSPSGPATDLSSRPPNDLSSRPESSQSHREDVAERPALGVAHTVYSPEPNRPGSVLPAPGNEPPYLLWTADNRIVFFSEADGWDHLYALDLLRDLLHIPHPPAAPRLLTPAASEVEDAIIAPERGVLIYSTNDDASIEALIGDQHGENPSGHPDPLDRDRRHLWQLDLDRSIFAPQPVAITHGEGIETQPALASTGVLAALVSDAHTPMHPALIGMAGEIAALHPVTPPASYPGAQFVTPKQVRFTSADGTALHGQLFLPQHLDPTRKHAALIFVHGGPRRQMLLGYPAMQYYSNAYAMNQYLVSRGFLVLSVNYRAGIGYGLDFRRSPHYGPNGAAEYNDVLAAAKYLAARPDVDPKRVGIWGGSYGGYLTALALARNSDLFAAGVDFHGIHDWNLEDNASDWKQGDFARQDALGKLALASSALNDLSHWRSPVLLIHGDNDPEVAYAQTPVLADALRARNASLPKERQVDVQELIFPDEVHEFLLHRDWLAAYTAAAAFFERTLKP